METPMKKAGPMLTLPSKGGMDTSSFPKYKWGRDVREQDH